MFTKKVVLAFLTCVGVLLFVGYLGSAPEEEVIAAAGPEGAFSSNLPIIFRALPTPTNPYADAIPHALAVANRNLSTW